MVLVLVHQAFLVLAVRQNNPAEGVRLSVADDVTDTATHLEGLHTKNLLLDPEVLGETVDVAVDRVVEEDLLDRLLDRR